MAKKYNALTISNLVTVLLCTLIFLTVPACSRNNGSNDSGAEDATGDASGGTQTQNAQLAAPPDMVLIPAGEFIMGSDKVDASGKSEEFGFIEPMYLTEHPKRTVSLEAFYIDKYEVTNGQFKQFLIESGKYTDAQLQTIYEKLKMDNDNLPVRIVTWFMASEFCRAAGKRLPTEAEWEKAARGANGLEYPWGNEWNPDYLNAGSGENDLMPVGSYEQGKSPYGVYDMAGNVMEWTSDWYEAYPGAEFQSPFYGKKRRAVRGGGWGGIGHYVIPHYFRAAYRYNFPPDRAFNDVGFRCAKDA
jgi:formylglycine-generating enzyme required for sulfatase activity